jgi:NADH dehydrogenase [ubiquinone] 1 alpha subcomplex assembly factor 5
VTGFWLGFFLALPASLGDGALVMTEAPSIPRFFDSAAQRRNRTRAAPGFDGFDFLKREAVLRMADRLALMRRDFPLCLDFGCHDGMLTREIMEGGKVGRVIQADPSPAFAASAASTGPAVAVEYDALPFAAGSFDAVFSCLLLHWIDDLPGVMAQIRRLLKPDGLCLVSLLGGATLAELRGSLLEAEQELVGGASPRTAPMADIRDVGGLLGRAGLALPVADSDRLTITYTDMFRLMADLRGMGEQNALLARSRTPARRQLFLRAAEIYHDRFAVPDGRIPASFEIITLTGWAPHESQQTPLRPGSAAHRLADMLGTAEQDPEA